MSVFNPLSVIIKESMNILYKLVSYLYDYRCETNEGVCDILINKIKGVSKLSKSKILSLPGFKKNNSLTVIELKPILKKSI